ncbi:hypothetical protein KP509_05G032600 [Ceratopteris richardii]|uniref:Uncharacterized protein n=1 Tax=Ceratopteris richardii TaxID=49495 RepID=A0A8T2UMS7_CERRI|nr:hypothetical protein KP509_05G032600 [Ceratopteris richardii]
MAIPYVSSISKRNAAAICETTIISRNKEELLRAGLWFDFFKDEIHYAACYSALLYYCICSHLVTLRLFSSERLSKHFFVFLHSCVLSDLVSLIFHCSLIPNLRVPISNF